MGIVPGLVAKGTAPRLGLASLLLLCAPTLAWAADPCSTPSTGTIVCDPTAAYPQGIHQDVDPAAPQDLTLVIGAGYSIATSDDEAHGIAVNNPTGAITVTGGNGTISTSGVRAAGIKLTGTGPTGDLTVVAGDVSTTGYRSDGISVSTNYGGNGNVSITAGNVQTSGVASNGIRAAATNGSVAVNAGTIGTTGYGSDGLFAETYNGDVGINVGSVSTNGAAGRGIVAYAGGAVTVNAGSVTTSGWAYGSDSDAGGIKAVGSSVRVNAGTVETWGPYSTGIYANSNMVHDAGTTADHDIIVTAGEVRTHGDYSYGIVGINAHEGGKVAIHAGLVSSTGLGIAGISREEGGSVDISVGTLTTFGTGAYGILAQAEGDITVSAGSVATSGQGSFGVVAISNSGKIDINVGSVETQEVASGGIIAASHVVVGPGETDPYIWGPVSITANHVKTTGASSTGITAVGSGISVTLTGDIFTTGAGSSGIYAMNYKDGALTINNNGSITTAGDRAGGIEAGSGTGSIVVSGKGTVETLGDYSAGIRAGLNGDLTVSQESVATRGDYSDGLHLVTVELFGDDLPKTPALDVNVGSVTTRGDHSTGIFAQNQLPGGTTRIIAHQVSTSGNDSYGIIALGGNGLGTVAIDADTVATLGDRSAGIAVEGGKINVTSSGAITTQGAGAVGINLYSHGGDVAVDVNAVATKGDGAIGIMATRVEGEGDITISAKDVQTAGSSATGILALVAAGSADIAIGAGSVATAGDDAAGIQAFSSGGKISIAADQVTTLGQHGDGIAATALAGAIDVNAGTIATTGGGAFGIRARSVGDSGDITIKAGDVSTTGERADAIFASSNYGGAGAISIEAGNVSTGGLASVGIRAEATEGSITIKASSATTSGYGGDGIVAFSYNGDVAVDVARVTTTGDAGRGIVAYSGGTATVNAGSVTTGGAGFGTDSDAAAIKAVGSAVHVTAGDVSTAGDYSFGIDAGTNLTHLNGQGDHDISVDAGTVSTTGFGSDAIHVLNVGDGGNTSVEAGTVSTVGDYAWGIYAATLYGDTSVKVDTLTTSGAHGNGVIAVSVTGNTEVTAGRVGTSGEGSIGIYAYSKEGLAKVSAGDVSTAGLGSAGIFANGDRAEIVTTGKIVTTGDYSAGVHAYGASAGVSITNSGTIATTGRNSYGMVANGFGPLVLANSGTLTTEGQFGHGIYAIASPSETTSVTIVNSGKITVKGADAQAIRAIGILSSVNVTSTGTIEADGLGSSGILAVADREARGGTSNPDANVAVTAASVVTRGDYAPAIQALNYAGGNVSVDAGSVLASGKDSAGIAVISSGTGTVKAGSVTAAGRGIFVVADQGASVTVTGAVTTANHVAIEVGGGSGDRVINIARGASVTGGGQHIESDGDEYVGRGNTIVMSGAGHNTLNNAGTIIGIGDRFTINLAETFDAESTATINNSGLLVGAVKLGDYDDMFNNSGIFEATKDSDFGGGNDLFVNTGTVRFGSLGPVGAKAKGASTVTLAGLDRFDNRGGLIDLRNEQTGDKLILPGSYQGSAGARLGLDVTFGAAPASDTLVVQGAATGATTIVLANVDAQRARLTATPITLVSVGAGSSADAFTLDPASSSAGFIQYGLRYDAASGTFGLAGVAGLPVHRLARASEAAQNIWLRSADAVGGHLTSVRDEHWAEGASGRLWGQMQGGVDTRHGDGTRSLAGGGSATFDDGYRQDYYGAQLGFDLARQSRAKGGAAFGVSAGYMSSKVKASAERLSFDALNGGFYASIGAGRFFASATAQYDHYWVKAANVGLGYRDQIQGSTWGASAEAGVRLGSEKLFVEPVANLAWTRTSLDDLQAFGQILDFDRATGLRGKAGLRGGAKTALGGGSTAIFYASGHVVHEFEGEAGLVLRSGGADAHIANPRLGTYGETTLGMSVLGTGAVSGYVEGVAHVGQSYRGGGVRAGLRLKF